MSQEKLLLALPPGLKEKVREQLTENFEELGLLTDDISPFTALFYKDFIKSPMKYKSRFAEEINSGADDE